MKMMKKKTLPLIVALMGSTSIAWSATCSDTSLRLGYARLSQGDTPSQIASKLNCDGTDGSSYKDPVGRPLLDRSYTGSSVVVRVTLMNNVLFQWSGSNLTAPAIVDVPPQWDPASRTLSLAMLARTDAGGTSTYTSNVIYTFNNNGTWSKSGEIAYDAGTQGAPTDHKNFASLDNIGRLTLPVVASGGKTYNNVVLLINANGTWNVLQGGGLISQPSNVAADDPSPSWTPLTRTLDIPVLASVDLSTNAISYSSGVRYVLTDIGTWSLVTNSVYNEAIQGPISAHQNVPTLDSSGRLVFPTIAGVNGLLYHNLVILLKEGGYWDVQSGGGLISSPSGVIPAVSTPQFNSVTQELLLPLVAINAGVGVLASPTYFSNVRLLLNQNGSWTIPSARGYDPVVDGSLSQYSVIPSFDSSTNSLSVPTLTSPSGNSTNVVIRLSTNSTWKLISGVGAGLPIQSPTPTGKLITSSNIVNYAGVKPNTVVVLTNGQAFIVNDPGCNISNSPDSRPSTPITPAIGVPGTPGYTPAVYGPPLISATPLGSVYDIGNSTFVLNVQGDPSACQVRQLY